ncbi:F5/8 type C domain-containing protein, partial [Durusdinium trenchii]
TVGIVDFFGFAFSGAAAQDAWRVEYSTDNVEWTAFGDDFDADGTQSRRASLAPGQSVSARYWRVRALAALDGRTLTFAAETLAVSCQNTSASKVSETASVSAAKLYGFAYDTEATYLMVQTDRNIEVYDAQVRKASIRAPHAHADVSVVNRAQSLDTLILVHEDYAPWRVQRYRDAGEWTADLVPLENIPLEQYSGETYFNGTNERQEVFMGGFTNGADRFNLMVGEDATEGILFSGGAVGGTGVTTAADIEDALEALDSVGVGNVTVTCNAANTFQIELPMTR